MNKVLFAVAIVLTTFSDISKGEWHVAVAHNNHLKIVAYGYGESTQVAEEFALEACVEHEHIGCKIIYISGYVRAESDKVYSYRIGPDSLNFLRENALTSCNEITDDGSDCVIVDEIISPGFIAVASVTEGDGYWVQYGGYDFDVTMQKAIKSCEERYNNKCRLFKIGAIAGNVDASIHSSDIVASANPQNDSLGEQAAKAAQEFLAYDLALRRQKAHEESELIIKEAEKRGIITVYDIWQHYVSVFHSIEDVHEYFEGLIVGKFMSVNIHLSEQEKQKMFYLFHKHRINQIQKLVAGDNTLLSHFLGSVSAFDKVSVELSESATMIFGDKTMEMVIILENLDTDLIRPMLK